MFRYQRRTVWNMGQWREEPEMITAQGPTDTKLIIWVGILCIVNQEHFAWKIVILALIRVRVWEGFEYFI